MQSLKDINAVSEGILMQSLKEKKQMSAKTDVFEVSRKSEQSGGR